MQAQKGDFFYNSSIDNNFLSYLLFLSSAWIVNDKSDNAWGGKPV